MDGPSSTEKRRLPRLAPENYRGLAFVHWSMSIEGRRTGWLDPLHHARLRELLCHALGKYQLVCPAYCLMPDHAHFLICGTAPTKDQRLAVRAFRAAWLHELAPGFSLQKQAHDHVLRDHERATEGFGAIAHYIFENPVRAGLCATKDQWSFSGCLIPGYPEFDARSTDYWDRFWRLWNYLVERPISA